MVLSRVDAPCAEDATMHVHFQGAINPLQYVLRTTTVPLARQHAHPRELCMIAPRPPQHVVARISSSLQCDAQ